ncbi:hypothetical protein VPNG_04623 [Cytospora leucostoma]|uniref:Uncharacterized protein n=1 Tax=Cytospora leucostoma TaxID=1230097 RepID=A0A423XC44_9PEZI|nr:hypothetical protein VPNG_04623 [Cytospora leucostoma]
MAQQPAQHHWAWLLGTRQVPKSPSIAYLPVRQVDGTVAYQQCWITPTDHPERFINCSACSYPHHPSIATCQLCGTQLDRHSDTEKPNRPEQPSLTDSDPQHSTGSKHVPRRSMPTEKPPKKHVRFEDPHSEDPLSKVQRGHKPAPKRSTGKKTAYPTTEAAKIWRDMEQVEMNLERVTEKLERNGQRITEQVERELESIRERLEKIGQRIRELAGLDGQRVRNQIQRSR